MPKYELKSEEQPTGGAFSNLPKKVADLMLAMLADKIDLNNFFKSLEGVPGKDNFYKRLRTGTKVKVLRSSREKGVEGEMDVEGWIIDPMPKKDELNNEATIRVHNKQKHIAKFVPLRDLIKWNI